METGWTTTTHAGSAALSANHFSRHMNIRICVHDTFPSDIRILNAPKVSPLRPIVNAIQCGDDEAGAGERRKTASAEQALDIIDHAAKH